MNVEICGQYFVIKTISLAATTCAFSCITTDTNLGNNSATTNSLAHVLRSFGSFLAWLQISTVNLSQLFFIANKLILIVHLDMQLYLLILYLFILNFNTINSYRDTGEALQHAVGIRLHECQCIIKAYSKKLIYNLHGYSIDSYYIHGGKTAKNGDEKKMAKNDTDVNSIIKLIIKHYQLLNILFDLYGILIRILIYDSCMNGGIIIIVIKKNINVTLQNIMDYLHNDLFNLFGLLKWNCINILMVFIRFLNIEATRYLIIIGEYNLMYFKCEIVFDVDGDQQIVLFQKKTEKIDERLQKTKSNKKLFKYNGAGKDIRMICLLCI